MKKAIVNQKASRTMLILSAFMVMASGCDYQSKRMETEMIKKQAADQAAELSDLREGMRLFIAGKIQLTKDALIPSEKTLESLQKDADALAAEVSAFMSEKDAKGNDLPLENRMLHLMRSKKVNDLAVQYLKTDFNQDAAVFIERVRTARFEEKRYVDAIIKVDELYAQNVKTAEKWSTMTASQRDAEKTRLTKELASLESSRKITLRDWENLTKGKLQGNIRQERERIERMDVLKHRLNDFDSEIYKKRIQLDALINPDANRKIETRAAIEQQSAQRDANRTREQALFDIERNMKPKLRVADVVTEIEKKTTGALQKTLMDSLTGQQEKIATLKTKLTQLEEAKLVVPISGKEELNQLRKKLQN